MGLLGNVVRVLGKTDFTVDVVGIDLLKLLKLPVFSAGGRIKTNRDNFLQLFMSMLASRLVKPFTQVHRRKTLTCALMKNPSRLVDLKA